MVAERAWVVAVSRAKVCAFGYRLTVAVIEMAARLVRTIKHRMGVDAMSRAPSSRWLRRLAVASRSGPGRIAIEARGSPELARRGK